MENKDIKKAIADYLDGRSDYKTEQKLMQFLSFGKENEALFRKEEEKWMKEHVPTDSQRASFRALLSDIRKRRRQRIYRVSASVAAVIAIGLIAFGYYSDIFSKPRYYAFSTDSHEKTCLTLPDSTKVWLNSASSIRYSDRFNRKDRNVELSGEAYFDVRHNAGLPFKVHAGSSVVTVTGTEFNITAYDQEDKISTALISGSVMFENGVSVLSMSPGELLVYDETNGSMSKREVDTKRYMSWIEGRLDYPDITLPDLLKRLSIIYGMRIDYTPEKYADRTFRIILNDKESISDILDAISFIVPISYECEGDVITVKEK